MYVKVKIKRLNVGSTAFSQFSDIETADAMQKIWGYEFGRARCSAVVVYPQCSSDSEIGSPCQTI